MTPDAKCFAHLMRSVDMTIRLPRPWLPFFQSCVIVNGSNLAYTVAVTAAVTVAR